MTEHNPQNPYTNTPWGHPVSNQYGTDSRQPVIQGNNGLAIAGLALTLVGGVLFFVPFIGALISLIGLVMAGFGLRNSGRYFAGRGRKVAIAGLLFGTLGTVAGGAVSTAVSVAGYYVVATTIKMVETHDRIERYSTEHGQLPRTLSDLSFAHGATDAFDNGLIYQLTPEGEYKLSARGISAFGTTIEQATGMMFDSATGNIKMTADPRQVVAPKENIQMLLEDLRNKHAWQSEDDGPTPLDQPKSSKPALPEPKSADDGDSDF